MEYWYNVSVYKDKKAFEERRSYVDSKIYESKNMKDAQKLADRLAKKHNCKFGEAIRLFKWEYGAGY